MKKTSIIVVLVALLAVGYFFYMRNTPKPEATTDTASAAKINIDAVCQGALAYMTFPDAASADAYVAECKEGKHPEVIERYRADMHLGEGAAI